MTQIQVTTKTPAEIAAAFKAVFKDRIPAAKAKALTQADRLAPYRKAVMQAREQGFNWKEIADGMADPRIAEKVTGKLLYKVFGTAAKTNGAPAKPASQRVVMDPKTGLPISPDAAATATAMPATAPVPVPPMTPKEHAAWDETLKQLIPTIVNTAMHRNDAQSYTDRVTERMKPADAARFHAIVEAELESMTDTTCATYGITPEAFGKWHRRWVRS